MQDNKKYCPDLFTGIFLQKEDENTTRIAHCCVSELSEPTDELSMNHVHLQKSRDYFLKTGELPKQCAYCIKSEEIGSPTHRSGRWKDLKEYPTEVKLKKLDYNCDNVCNLKCIICGGHYSSAWLEDEVKLGLRKTINIKKTKHNNTFEQIDVQHIEQVYFNGGEPLMSKDHINVLNQIVAKHPDVSKVRVLYSINGTFEFTDEMLNIWKNFYEVSFLVSIDAIEECFEYTRYGAKWSDVEQVLLSYQKTGLSNIKLRIGASVGLHNILYFGDLIKWSTDNNYKLSMQQNVWGELSTMNFPKKYFNQLKNYVHGLPECESKCALVELIETVPNISEQSYQWVNELTKLDAIRGNNWKKSLSRLYELDPEMFDQIISNDVVKIQLTSLAIRAQ